MEMGKWLGKSLLTMCGLLMIVGAVYAKTPVMPVLYLNGDDAYATLPGGVTDGIMAGTVEAWVSWGKFGRFSRVFDFGEKGHAVLLQNEKTSQKMNFSIYDKENNRHRIQMTQDLEPHVWYHVAAVFGAQGMKLFVNGELVGTEAYYGPRQLPENARLLIGKSNWNGDDLFQGYVCDLRVWEEARTAHQIRQMMYRRLVGNERHLRAYYRFDALEGRAIRDLSANGFHATMMGNATVMTVPGPPIEYAPNGVSEADQIDTKKEGALTQASYQLLFRMALLDGRVDAGEKQVLDRAVRDQKLTEQDKKQAEWDVHGELGTGPVNQQEDTYCEILTAAFADGQLSQSEASLLELMKGRLRLSGERAQVLKNMAQPTQAGEVTQTISLDAPVGGHAYQSLLQTALADRVIDDREEGMLSSFRLSNGLSEVDAKKVEHDVRQVLRIGPVNSEEETYFVLLKTAYVDGVLSESELAMLEGLKSKLGISDRRAETLVKDIVRPPFGNRYGIVGDQTGR